MELRPNALSITNATNNTHNNRDSFCHFENRSFSM